MKDQYKLLKDCIKEQVPAIVFQGDDSCTVEILETAKNIYEKKGCSAEFLYDFQLLIDDFKAYQKENTNRVKLPKLSISEMQSVTMLLQSSEV